MRYLIFELDNNFFAIDILNVVEAKTKVIFTKIAKVKEYIIGLYNYRNQIVPILDSSLLITNINITRINPNIIILKDQDMNINALTLDKVLDIVQIDKNDIKLNERTNFNNISNYFFFEDKKIYIIEITNLLQTEKDYEK